MKSHQHEEIQRPAGSSRAVLCIGYHSWTQQPCNPRKRDGKHVEGEAGDRAGLRPHGLHFCRSSATLSAALGPPCLGSRMAASCGTPPMGVALPWFLCYTRFCFLFSHWRFGPRALSPLVLLSSLGRTGLFYWMTARPLSCTYFYCAPSWCTETGLIGGQGVSTSPL